MDLSQYFATHTLRPDALVADWHWLIGDGPYQLHQITLLGDPILVDSSGRVLHLYVSGGELIAAGESIAAFEKSLQEDRDVRRAILSTSFLRDIIQRLGSPGLNRCYSWKIPQHLFKGDDDEENLETSNIVAYWSVMGQLHRQMAKLPRGTNVDGVIVDGVN